MVRIITAAKENREGKMAKDSTAKKERSKGNMIKVVTGTILSLAVVLGSVVLAQPKDAEGTLPVAASSASEEVSYVSSNRETIVTGPDGQQVIQNSFDGSMVNFDGSPYNPMVTPDQLGTAATPVASYGKFPAKRIIQNTQTIVVGPDGQWVLQNSGDGTMYNLDGSPYTPMPVDEGTGRTTIPQVKSTQALAQSNENFMFWLDGKWVVQNADGTITDQNGNLVQ
jgi:hypothetical protein